MPDSVTLAQTLITLSSGENADKEVEQFFIYLEKNNLNSLLPQIKKHVTRIQQQQDDFNTLVVRSRHPLSSDEIQDIKKVTGAHDTVTLTTEITEDVLGSFQAQYRGKMYDGSLQSAVTQLNNTLNVSL